MSPAADGGWGESQNILSYLISRLEDFFTLEFVSLSGNALQSLLASSKDYILGVLGLKHGYLVLLREKEDVSLGSMMPANRSQVYQKFDISILNHIILDKIMGSPWRKEISLIQWMLLRHTSK